MTTEIIGPLCGTRRGTCDDFMQCANVPGNNFDCSGIHFWDFRMSIICSWEDQGGDGRKNPQI